MMIDSLKSKKRKKKDNSNIIKVDSVLPDCDFCGTNEFVKYYGPGSNGGEFYCKKCKGGWTQSW